MLQGLALSKIHTGKHGQSKFCLNYQSEHHNSLSQNLELVFRKLLHRFCYRTAFFKIKVNGDSQLKWFLGKACASKTVTSLPLPHVSHDGFHSPPNVALAGSAFHLFPHFVSRPEPLEGKCPGTL